ncbi:MAG TPA: S-methyl-5-thioribose-1-phosphate isomerase [Armatimonadota bacterium]|nr:S-methyl-5-thioribose-1-phosphate isomerase [Armatimonadota bacterium]HOS44272.1 S-methyl-5-thioribose-1-phosphate isomerase [Armatimonadota bacterium]
MTLRTSITPVRWEDDGLRILDQRRLPRDEYYLACRRPDAVAEAIRTLAVRGAPLIGITAAYGMALAAREAESRERLLACAELLAATRPTAVNLFWALDRQRAVVAAHPDAAPGALAPLLLEEARAIHAEDAAACLAMAAAGAALCPAGARVLTHCNTGALATGGIGTALGVIRAARAAGRLGMVWVDETRPLLQGARLTAWEFARDDIPHRLLCDNMAAALMAAGEVDLVMVGADRITRAGDFANKIGTYGLAVLAHAHQIPFYVAAPWSTVDLALADGRAIPVESRGEEEVTHCGHQLLAPAGTRAWNPAFDVTPAALVTGFITERGVVKAPVG